MKSAIDLSVSIVASWKSVLSDPWSDILVIIDECFKTKGFDAEKYSVNAVRDSRWSFELKMNADHDRRCRHVIQLEV